MGRTSNWVKFEDQLLLKIFFKNKSKKWQLASKALKQNGFQRSPSECRERFINYLTPNINKDNLTNSELVLLYKKYEEVGPRWSEIQQFVVNKTQCKLKNIFYGNIRNLLKTTYKYFTSKTASFMNKITTQQIQSIYDATGQFKEHRCAKQGIEFINYRNNKHLLFTYIKKHQHAFLALINKVMVTIFHSDQISVKGNIQQNYHNLENPKLYPKITMVKVTRKKSQIYNQCEQEQSQENQLSKSYQGNLKRSDHQQFEEQQQHVIKNKMSLVPKEQKIIEVKLEEYSEEIEKQVNIQIQKTEKMHLNKINPQFQMNQLQQNFYQSFPLMNYNYFPAFYPFIGKMPFYR